MIGCNSKVAGGFRHADVQSIFNVFQWKHRLVCIHITGILLHHKQRHCILQWIQIRVIVIYHLSNLIESTINREEKLIEVGASQDLPHNGYLPCQVLRSTKGFARFDKAANSQTVPVLQNGRCSGHCKSQIEKKTPRIAAYNWRCRYQQGCIHIQGG